VFVREGYNIDFVSPKGGHAPVDPGSVEKCAQDKICAAFLKNNDIQKAIKNTMKPEDVNSEKYAAVFFPGGYGPMFDLPDNKRIQDIVRDVYERSQVVSGVCHGQVGLVNVKLSNGNYLIKGKEVTGFSNAEEEEMKLQKVLPFLLETRLKENGGQYTCADPWKPKVVTSERIVTGQNPESSTGTAEAIVSILKKQKKSK